MIIKMASTSNLRVPKADYTQIPTSASPDPYRWAEVTHIAALRFRGWRPSPASVWRTASWRLRRSDGTRGESAASAAEDGGGARRGRENRRCAALMAHGDGWGMLMLAGRTRMLLLAGAQGCWCCWWAIGVSVIAENLQLSVRAPDGSFKCIISCRCALTLRVSHARQSCAQITQNCLNSQIIIERFLESSVL